MNLGNLTRSHTQSLLKQLQHIPKKALGQNFLIDSNIVKKSIELAKIDPGDIVVEVGPGLGTLTATLLEKGVHVYAIELDNQLAEYLRKTLFPAYPHTFHLMCSDALKYPTAGLDLAAFDTSRSTTTTRALHQNDENDSWDQTELSHSNHTSSKALSYKIVANLPYAISTPWFESVLPIQEQAFKAPYSFTLMLQREAINRFNASLKTKSFSPISIFLQSAYSVETMHAVSNTCFYPIPEVESSLVHIKRLENPFFFKLKTRKLIRFFFTQRRKQISSLCRQRQDLKTMLDTWLKTLDAQHIGSSTRPEAIPLPAWQILDSLC